MKIDPETEKKGTHDLLVCPLIPTRKKKKKGKHNLLLCLRILSWWERAVDNIKVQFKFFWNGSKIENNRKGEKNSEKDDIECVRSTWYWKDIRIIWLWQLSTTNHHHIRWVWELWWNPHDRGLRYSEPREGLLWQDCCRREEQLQLASDQSSERDY